MSSSEWAGEQPTELPQPGQQRYSNHTCVNVAGMNVSTRLEEKVMEAHLVSDLHSSPCCDVKYEFAVSLALMVEHGRRLRARCWLLTLTHNTSGVPTYHKPRSKSVIQICVFRDYCSTRKRGCGPVLTHSEPILDGRKCTKETTRTMNVART
mgnify:CR=1 FL=1